VCPTRPTEFLPFPEIDIDSIYGNDKMSWNCLNYKDINLSAAKKGGYKMLKK